MKNFGVEVEEKGWLTVTGKAKEYLTVEYKDKLCRIKLEHGDVTYIKPVDEPTTEVQTIAKGYETRLLEVLERIAKALENKS